MLHCPIKSVANCSSQSARFPAENLLTGGTWLTKGDDGSAARSAIWATVSNLQQALAVADFGSVEHCSDESASVTVHLQSPSLVKAVFFRNRGAEFVELSGEGDRGRVLLHRKAKLMRPGDVPLFLAGQKEHGFFVPPRRLSKVTLTLYKPESWTFSYGVSNLRVFAG